MLDIQDKSDIIKTVKERGVTKMTTNEMITYDEIVEKNIATPEELNLARNLMDGTWEEVLNAVIFVRTGYRDLQQLIDCEEEE